MTTEYRIGNTGSETGNYTDSANGIVAFGCQDHMKHAQCMTLLPPFRSTLRLIPPSSILVNISAVNTPPVNVNGVVSTISWPKDINIITVTLYYVTYAYAMARRKAVIQLL